MGKLGEVMTVTKRFSNGTVEITFKCPNCGIPVIVQGDEKIIRETFTPEYCSRCLNLLFEEPDEM